MVTRTRIARQNRPDYSTGRVISYGERWSARVAIPEPTCCQAICVGQVCRMQQSEDVVGISTADSEILRIRLAPGRDRGRGTGAVKATRFGCDLVES